MALGQRRHRQRTIGKGASVSASPVSPCFRSAHPREGAHSCRRRHARSAPTRTADLTSWSATANRRLPGHRAGGRSENRPVRHDVLCAAGPLRFRLCQVIIATMLAQGLAWFRSPRATHVATRFAFDQLVRPVPGAPILPHDPRRFGRKPGRRVRTPVPFRIRPTRSRERNGPFPGVASPSSSAVSRRHLRVTPL